MPTYQKLTPPKEGQRISVVGGQLRVPDRPIIPYVEGDGTGPDIWRASRRVIDAAVAKAYGGKRTIIWFEVFAGEKSNAVYGEGTWLPDDTIEAIKDHVVGIKGPLTTPVGGGFRSINVTLRQVLDLYVCLRPVLYFSGVPSPVKHPELIDMVIFRENTEDVYTGIEFEAGSDEVHKLLTYVRENFPKMYGKIRFPESTAIGLKPISKEGSERLIRAAIKYAIAQRRKSVTFVHKGNIQKFTEGGFRSWGYALAKREFGDHVVSWDDCGGKPPAGKVLIKDAIADAFLQQILTRPSEFDVIATMNLNGDYISDALAAQVGGIGIAPGGNINFETGYAVFEATHGTAPKYAGQDKVNPGSVILSGEMMLRYLGWNEAADRILSALEKTIRSKVVTYDLARLMEGATEVKCSEFGEAIVTNM